MRKKGAKMAAAITTGFCVLTVAAAAVIASMISGRTNGENENGVRSSRLMEQVAAEGAQDDGGRGVREVRVPDGTETDAVATNGQDDDEHVFDGYLEDEAGATNSVNEGTGQETEQGAATGTAKPDRAGAKKAASSATEADRAMEAKGASGAMKAGQASEAKGASGTTEAGQASEAKGASGTTEAGQAAETKGTSGTMEAGQAAETKGTSGTTEAGRAAETKGASGTTEAGRAAETKGASGSKNGENAKKTSGAKASKSTGKASEKSENESRIYVGDSLLSDMGTYGLFKDNDDERLIYKVGVSPYTFYKSSMMDKLLGAEADHLFLLLGMNALDGNPAERQLDSAIRFTQKILEAYQEKYPKAKITILTLPPVRPNADQKLKTVELYNTKLEAMAKDMELECVDIWKDFRKKNGSLKKKYSEKDGIHWNIDGCRKFRELVEELS